jgi:HSP20 family protein
MTTVARNFNGFPTFFNELFSENNYAQSPATLPPANISENENGFHISLAAPGYKKEDFKIEVHQKALKISVSKEGNTTETQDKFLKREFDYDAFTRTFRLPNSVDIDAIDALYINGVLNLSIPKKEEAKPKEPVILAVK